MHSHVDNRIIDDAPHCCPCCEHCTDGINRRGFLGGTAVIGAAAMTGLSWATLTNEGSDDLQPPQRRPLVVKPVLCYANPKRREQRSWRGWGGVQTPEDTQREIARIKKELEKLREKADFPVKILPLSLAQREEELSSAKEEIASADVALVYAAGGRGLLEVIGETAKNTIIFCRHKSGPVYLWYEIVSPRYLRAHTDKPAVEGVDVEDVVIDDQEDIIWRLRALCGLANTVGARILTIGGPRGWAEAKTTAPKLAEDRFKLDIRTVPYEELGKLIEQARADKQSLAEARRRADEYLNLPNTTLETERKFVNNAFLLETIFRRLLREAETRAFTINSCMGTIMKVAETTACLPLSTMNDDGYLAFCESDFVVIPAGLLLGNISGKPQFLNDPTFPHKGVITLAHCTGPRKMDGKNIDPARILTHYESDYGAATKVEMPRGQVLTNIIPDFNAERYLGVRGEIVDAPFLPICRDQIDVRFDCDSLELARQMRGFHWITCYGDYLREFGYALTRVGIEWKSMTA